MMSSDDYQMRIAYLEKEILELKQSLSDRLITPLEKIAREVPDGYNFAHLNAGSPNEFLVIFKGASIKGEKIT